MVTKQVMGTGKYLLLLHNPGNPLELVKNGQNDSQKVVFKRLER